MRTKFNIFRALSTALRTQEWGRGVSVSSLAVSFPHLSHCQAPGSGEGQTRADRCAYDEVRAEHPRTRSRGREIAGDDERARKRGAVICVAITMGLSLAAAPPALALTRTVLTSSIAGPAAGPLSNPTDLAVDPQSHDVYVANPSTNQHLTLTINATGGTYALTFEGQTTSPISFNAVAGRERGMVEEHSVQEHLEQVGSFGVGNVVVTGPQGGPYTVELTGALGGVEQPPITVDASGLTGGSHSVEIATTRPAHAVAEVEKFTSSGAFLYMLGKEVNATTNGNVCTASETCQPGALGTAPGAFTNPTYLAVDPVSGDLYAADPGDHRISKFDSSGNLIASWGAAGQLTGFSALYGIAVGAGGELFVLDGGTVHCYSPSGEPLREFNTPAKNSPSPSGLAIDAEGRLYNNGVKFNGAFGEFLGRWDEVPNDAFPLAIAPSTNELYVLHDGEFDGEFVSRLASTCPEQQTLQGECTPLESFGAKNLSEAHGIAVDTGGTVYVADTGHSRIAIFTPVLVPELSTASKVKSQSSVELSGEVKPAGGGEVTECQFEYNHDIDETETVEISGATGGTFTLLAGVRRTSLLPFNASSIEVQHALEEIIGQEDVRVTGPPGGPYTVEYVGSLADTPIQYELGSDASSLTPHGATVTVHVTTVGVPGGSTPIAVPCLNASGEPAAHFAGEEEVHAELTGLTPKGHYHFRLTAANARATDVGPYQSLLIPLPPEVGAESVSEVAPDAAAVHAQIEPGGGDTHYHVAYLTQEQFEENEEQHVEEFSGAQRSASLDAGSAEAPQSFTAHLGGLEQATTYHYRVVAENALKAVAGAPRTFTTLAGSSPTDPCPNAHVRQQTGSAGLLDCRAYELVSAANSGGYDVESSLVEGQTPLAGFPEAAGRVLYGVHGGGIPGTDHPTDRGVDPYLATRGPEGWSTQYVGIPSNATPSTSPFASTLQAADASLSLFSFGGSEICSPCFADGSAGEPLRLANGELIQGMAGSLDPGPNAQPASFIVHHLSADGAHFLFGSTSKFEPAAEEGKISIYDRDLTTGETNVVSTAPGGGNLSCEVHCSTDGIGALDISTDGSHILIGKLVSEEGGNKYWRLYMNVGDSSHTVELTPGTTHGVLYDGMTADGSKVFFSSVDHLTGQDTAHTGADIFEAEVSEAGTATLHLISKGLAEVSGQPGDTASCDPVSNSIYAHWNTTGATENCGDLAIGGGGGVSSEGGAIYFLSPERLTGSEHGVPNAPNLYLARPGDAYAPHYVTTLESSLNATVPPKVHPFRDSFGSFAQPTAIAIPEAPAEEGDSYVLDVTREEGSGFVEKFDSSGNPVVGFGQHGKIEGQNAHGSGVLESGSTKVESVTTASGAFAVGQEISGAGIPAETTIAACSPSCEAPTSLEISQPATASGPAPLHAKRRFSDVSFAGLPTGIAVDDDPESPSYRDLYVPDMTDGLIDKFKPSGEFISQIEVGAYHPTAVAVDRANGYLYATNYSGSQIEVYDPNGNPVTSFATAATPHPTGVAVDTNGTVYVVDGGGFYGGFNTGGTAGVYKPSSTSPSLEYTEPGEQIDPRHSVGIAVDPENDVYVDEGSQVTEFDPARHELGAPLGKGLLTDSIGLGASSEALDISNPGSGKGGTVATYRAVAQPSPQTDNPLVIDGVSSPEVRHTADFQLTPSGDDAAFPSTLALAGNGEETAGHSEVYRYDAPTEKLTCVSCSTTGAPSAGDASLAFDGLSLTNDGSRVFFNTTDALVGSDTDKRQDVYEWELPGQGNCETSSPTFNKASGACLALISAGTSAFDSGLLSVDANGNDAYFFTRDSLALQDKNGPTMKIYDAREGGGFPYQFPSPACKSSDECHGASSPAPPPLQVGTESGTPHNAEEEPKPKSCKHGFVLKHGKCVKRHSKKHHKSKKLHGKRRAHNNRRAGK